MMGYLQRIFFGKALPVVVLTWCVWFFTESSTQRTSIVGPCDPAIDKNKCNTTRLRERFAGEDRTIILAGLFPVHKFDKTRQTCGKIQDKGFQRMEAVRFAVNRINADKSLLPGVKIAYELFDTCSHADTALKAVLPITTKGASSSNGQCSSTTRSKRAVAAIGASSSTVSIALADLLGLFGVPVISYASTSHRLSLPRYKFFLRTVPPDSYQARVMVDLVVYFGWKLVNVIHSDDDYGRDGAGAFISQAEKRGICVGSRSEIDRHGTASDSRFRTTLENLLVDTTGNPANRSQVVILFSANAGTRQLFETAKTIRQVQRRYVWIASDSTGENLDLPNTDLNSIGSLLSVIPAKSYLKSVADHMGAINVNDSKTNPWLKEYWRARFQCELGSNQECNQNKLNSSSVKSSNSKYKQNDKVLFAANAVYAVAHALHNILACDRMACKTMPSEMAYLGTHLLQELKRLGNSYQGVNAVTHSFDKNGDPVTASYQVQNLQQIGNSLQFETVATWSRDAAGQGKLILSKTSIHWPNNAHAPPKSVCSNDCLPGQYAAKDNNQLRLSSCCWVCETCTGHTYTHNQTEACRSCKRTQEVVTNHTGCVDLKARTTHHESVIVIVSVIIAISAGLVIVSHCALWYKKVKEINTITDQVEKENEKIRFLHKPMGDQFFVLAILWVVTPLCLQLAVPVTHTWCSALNFCFAASITLPFIPVMASVLYVWCVVHKHFPRVVDNGDDVPADAGMSQPVKHNVTWMNMMSTRRDQVASHSMSNGRLSVLAIVLVAIFFIGMAVWQSEAKTYIRNHSKVFKYCSSSMIFKLSVLISVIVAMVFVTVAHQSITNLLEELGNHTKNPTMGSQENLVDTWQYDSRPGTQQAMYSIIVAATNCLAFFVVLFVLEGKSIETADITKKIAPTLAIVSLAVVNFHQLHKSLPGCRKSSPQ